MIKILIITDSLAHNGTETFIMNEYRCLDNSKFHVDFLLNKDVNTDYSREVKRTKSKIFYIPPRKSNPIKYYMTLNNFFSKYKNDYQAIHYCCGSLSSIAPVYYAFKYQIPVRIIHAHSSSCKGLHNKMLHYSLRGFGNNLATCHLACSDSAASFFSLKRKYRVINNGIDVSTYSFDEYKRKRIRKILDIDSNTIVIGHVGRFEEVKNHSFLVNIFIEFVKIRPNSKLLLVGQGKLLDEIKRMVSDLGLSDKVIFLGQRSYVADIMQVMDIFIMPSLFEGLPFVLVEAQASGLPCIISDVIDKQVDLTGNIIYGSLVDAPCVWADKIEKVMSYYLRTKTDEKIKKAGFSIQETTRLIENIYCGANSE